MKESKNTAIDNTVNPYIYPGFEYPHRDPYRDSWTQPGFYQDCPHRLPCGICTKTNSMCPLNPGITKPTWATSNGTGGSCNE